MSALPATLIAADTTPARLTADQARALTEEVRRDAEALWRKLHLLHEGGAHTALGYASWAAYAQAEFGFGKSRAYQMLDAGRVVAVLDSTNGGTTVLNERQARELTPLLRGGEAEVLEVVRELRAQHGDDQVTAKLIRRLVKDRMRKIARQKAAGASKPLADAPILPDGVDLRLGPFQTVLADVRGVGLVVTDPPYDRASLPLWSDLGLWAAQALTPGGLLVAYSGSLYLPEVMSRLGEHLEYVWLGHLVVPGQNRLACWPSQINQRAKPILLYSRGRYVPTGWITDTLFVGGDTPENQRLHRWQQSVTPVGQWIEQLTEPGTLIADPMLGSGSFALAAHQLGRRIVGAEIDAAAYATAVNRLRA